MDTLFTQLQPRIASLVAQVKAVAKDGRVTIAEAWELVQSVVMLAYFKASQTDLTGEQKKQMVLALLGYAFDSLWPVLLLPPKVRAAYGAITWVLGWYLPAGWERSAFLHLASATIEGIHKYVKSRKPKPEPAPEPPVDADVDPPAPAVVVPAPAPVPAPAGK